MMNKVVVVIGASSGIGLAVVRKFLNNGYIVYSASRKICEEINVKNVFVDAAHESTIINGLETIYQEEKRIDSLIYVAGFSMASPLEFVDEADYRYLFEVNLFGFMAACKYLIPIMKENQGGKIIAISSLGGKVPIPYDSFYSASKAALDMFCFNLHIELEKYNIGVTSVIPGGVITPFTFKRRTYDQNSFKSYQDMASAVKSLALHEQKGINPVKVADSVFKVVNSKRKVVWVAVGSKAKIYFYASNFLPKRILVHLVRKAFKLKK